MLMSPGMWTATHTLPGEWCVLCHFADIRLYKFPRAIGRIKKCDGNNLLNTMQFLSIL